MSFDDDADIPMNDLMKQGGVPHQQVISLIGGVKRMVPGGPLADSFTVRGYPVDSHPLWFGTRKQRDGEPDGGGGGLGTPQGGKGDPGDGGGDEPLDTVFTPKTAVPIGQGSQVVFTPPPPSPPSEHRGASQGASQTSPPPPQPSGGASQGASQTSPPPPGSTNTITAAQQNLLQQNGVTYEAANGIWVKTVPQGAGARAILGFIGSYLRSLSSLDFRRVPRVRDVNGCELTVHLPRARVNYELVNR